MITRAYDIPSGVRFNRLVTQRRRRKRGGSWEILCVCDCGAKVFIRYNHLLSRNTQSCGCLNMELTIARTIKRNTTHGHANTPLYKIWSGMKDRCRNDRCKEFKYYGARGIDVCEEWNDFAVFRKWSIQHGYVRGLSIDRIDNDGDYCPENCRWVTRSFNSSRKHGPYRKKKKPEQDD